MNNVLTMHLPHFTCSTAKALRAPAFLTYLRAENCRNRAPKLLVINTPNTARSTASGEADNTGNLMLHNTSTATLQHHFVQLKADDNVQLARRLRGALRRSHQPVIRARLARRARAQPGADAQHHETRHVLLLTCRHRTLRARRAYHDCPATNGPSPEVFNELPTSRKIAAR